MSWVQVPSPPLENHSRIKFGKGLAARSEIWMILAPVTGSIAEANESVKGKLIFDKMVGLVDGILKFISSGLFSQFWEWMDNAI